MDLGYRAAAAIAWAGIHWTGARLRITGLRNIPDRGPAVIAINHTALVDFLFAGVGVQKANGRPVRFLAKHTIWQRPVAGRIMRICRQIPVDRSHGAQGLRRALDALATGDLVGIYPEATPSRSFELKHFKTGAVRMAQQTGCPIIPTIVWGAQRIWTKDHPRNLSRSHIPVRVAYGRPLQVGPEEDVVAATAKLRATMARMLDDVIAEYPPMTGTDLAFLPARWGGTAPTPAQAYARDLAEMQQARDGLTG